MNRSKEAAIKIGIISDTHDNVPNVKKAVESFNAAGVGAVLHCGDFVAPFAMLPFLDLECKRLYAVFGNNDGEKKGLMELASRNGWILEKGPMEITLSGRKIVMMHEPDDLESFCQKEGYDVIVYGHMHREYMAIRSGSLVINPGEGGGWVTGKASYAILDLGTMRADIFPIT